MKEVDKIYVYIQGSCNVATGRSQRTVRVNGVVLRELGALGRKREAVLNELEIVWRELVY